MSIGREWIKAIQNTPKLLHALGRGWEIPSFSIRNKSRATSIRVHKTSAACQQLQQHDRGRGMEEKSGLHDPKQNFCEVTERQRCVLQITSPRTPIIP